MLIPSSDQPYCYCISKETEETMLTCQKCQKLFHLGCLQSGRPTALLGDSFFELTCAVCNDGEELLSRMKISWMQVVMLAMYNLHVDGVSGKCGYYRWKEHICEFIGKHWNTFFGLTKKKSGNWKGTVAGTLSAGCPTYFQSGMNILNETGWWCLSEVKPPALDDSIPKARAMMAQAASKKEEHKGESPAKSLRERRYKHSIQAAAIELKAKRDGNEIPIDVASANRKRTYSSSSCPDPTQITASSISVSGALTIGTKGEAAAAAASADLSTAEPVEVELQTVVVKEENGDEESDSLVNELLRSAGGGASDDDFEVDPCSISPCDSPLMTSQTDVSHLWTCIDDCEPIADFTLDPNVAPCDVSAADSSTTPSNIIATNRATPSNLIATDPSATPSNIIATNPSATPSNVHATPTSDVIKTTMTSSANMTSDSEEESDAEESESEEDEKTIATAVEEKRSRFRQISVYEEKHLLRKLDALLEHKTDDLAANRLRAKLRLRQIKRERGLQVFDLDAKVQRRIMANQQQNDANSAMELTAAMTSSLTKLNGQNLATNRAGTDDRVLDRFQCSTAIRHHGATEPRTFLQRLIGGADRQATCIVSPYTTRQLKPYIRRDYKCRPTKLRLLQEILAYSHRNNPSWRAPSSSPIDYCYVRPQHILSINQLCQQFFWPGIDLSECLQYPDFSCVVVYKRIVIAFAFLVPDVAYNETYVSFIFTHPDWRGAGIATFMIYHLIQTCLGKDVTLHVSATNPAMVLYQKFGFKPEEFVLDFYDKYYPYDSKECRHAFFLRLRR